MSNIRDELCRFIRLNEQEQWVGAYDASSQFVRKPGFSAGKWTPSSGKLPKPLSRLDLGRHRRMELPTNGRHSRKVRPAA
jgi:hypothetical protein